MKNPILIVLDLLTAGGARKLVCTTLIVALFSTMSFAQDAQTPVPMATLNQQGILQIPADQELMEMYQFSLESLNFSSDEELIAFLSGKSSENFIIRPNTGEGIGLLVLLVNKQTEWTSDDWNAHLAEVCGQNPVKQ